MLNRKERRRRHRFGLGAADICAAGGWFVRFRRRMTSTAATGGFFFLFKLCELFFRLFCFKNITSDIFKTFFIGVISDGNEVKQLFIF